ncbi:MAG: hypothetical protein JWO38_8316 [Gemmataceae bacterium]|nr:hypothetical protein [Gemmataceae bacterium]
MGAGGVKQLAVFEDRAGAGADGKPAEIPERTIGPFFFQRVENRDIPPAVTKPATAV